jgi:hypothetical protein
MKFIKELDYTFVLLILYIIKSVVLPGAIDLGVLVLLSSAFVLKYITNKLANTKSIIEGDRIELDRFKIVEEFAAKDRVFSENQFRDGVNRDMTQILERVANLETVKSFNNYGKRK